MMKEYSLEEKQFITSLSWFRSRYALYMGLDPQRKATEEAIKSFAEFWIGTFLLPWTDMSKNLISKKIIEKIEDEFCFTDFGKETAKQLEIDTPFYKYEYDNFYTSILSSNAHSQFCEQVYGEDLSQHGLVDNEELSLFLKFVNSEQKVKILDVGCGNGRITHKIGKESVASCVGIDISSEGINFANTTFVNCPNLQFLEADMNALQLTQKFDCIVFIDTLYYVRNIKDTLLNSLKLLEENGHICVYLSSWVLNESQKAMLLPENSYFISILCELDLQFQAIDLTSSGISHWKKKLYILENMKKQFEEEGNTLLWQYRYNEAFRYAKWDDQLFSRYFYVIQRKQPIL